MVARLSGNEEKSIKEENVSKMTNMCSMVLEENEVEVPRDK